MHIYSVLNKLFTPKIEQNKVQDNTNQQKKNFQDENKEKKYPVKSGNFSQPKNDNGNKGKTNYQETARVLFAKDGDTFLGMYNREQYNFRLAGINAPEKGKAWSKEATEFLNKTIKGKSVYLEFLGEDKYGREIVEVYLDKEKNIHVNKMLLEAGLATSERYKNNQGKNTHNVVDYAKNELTETVAKIKDVGMWSGEPPKATEQETGIFDDDNWRDQMNTNNKSSKTKDEVKLEQDNEPVFNPFANPPIEPLDVFPKGFTSNEELKLHYQQNNNPINNSLPEENSNNVQLTESLNTKEVIDEPVFNPFANPPIEPLDVFPKEVTNNEELVKENIKVDSEVSIDYSSTIPDNISSIPEDLFFDDNNIVFDNQPIDLDSMPSYMDDYPPMELDVNHSINFDQQDFPPMEELISNDVAHQEEKIQDKKLEKPEVITENKPVENTVVKPKIQLKIGAKKPFNQETTELIEPTLEIPVESKKPTIISEPVLIENKVENKEVNLSAKAEKIDEDDPFSMVLDSHSTDNHLSILNEFDCMGEKITEVATQEESTTKKRKLGR